MGGDGGDLGDGAAGGCEGAPETMTQLPEVKPISKPTFVGSATELGPRAQRVGVQPKVQAKQVG